MNDNNLSKFIKLIVSGKNIVLVVLIIYRCTFREKFGLYHMHLYILYFHFSNIDIWQYTVMKIIMNMHNHIVKKDKVRFL